MKNAKIFERNSINELVDHSKTADQIIQQVELRKVLPYAERNFKEEIRTTHPTPSSEQDELIQSMGASLGHYKTVSESAKYSNDNILPAKV